MMTICEQEKTDIYNRIGQNIKKYRKINKITQRELAIKSSVSENLIAKLKSKTHQTISIDTLDIIADALGIDIALLFEKEIV